jgi:hypothetical protein
MIDTIAKPVVKDKFWIVERNGNKCATIQAIDEDGGYAYVHDNQREYFPSIKLLSKQYNITFEKAERKKTVHEDNIYGFPTSGKHHNALFDVQKYLPIYTKTKVSKSYFCAGYYAVKLNNVWVRQFCPKLIMLNRYEYCGPFATQDAATKEVNERNG